jgi:DNA repair photolyase
VLLPGVPAPAMAPLIGEEVVREQGSVRYLELRTRSLVGRCSERRMPFDWTANTFRGCAMGCRYCYAAYTHGFIGRDGAREFHSRVYVKAGGEAETARRLQLAARRGERVALGSATDPYQPGESAARVTRRFLEIASGVRGLRLSITTKGALVLRDIDLLQRLSRSAELSVAVSLVSPDAPLLRRLEPWAPPPDVRVEVLRRLTEAGLRTGLALAPILPGLSDGEPEIDRLLARVAAAGVRGLWWSLLFLRSPTRESFLAWLGREIPERVAGYRRLYAGRTRIGGEYAARIDALVRRLAERHGFSGAAFEPRARPPAQLALWE